VETIDGSLVYTLQRPKRELAKLLTFEATKKAVLRHAVTQWLLRKPPLTLDGYEKRDSLPRLMPCVHRNKLYAAYFSAAVTAVEK